MLYQLYRKASSMQLVLIIVLMLMIWMRSLVSDNTVHCFHQLSILCPSLAGLNDFWGGVPARLLAMFLLLAAGFALNAILSGNHLIGRQTFFPALILSLFASYAPAIQNLHPVLPAIVLLLWALHFLLKAYEKPEAIGEVFSAGLLTGLAVLFHFPIIAFILFLLISLMIYRISNWRLWAAVVTGFLTPLGYTVAIAYFIHGREPIRQFLNEVPPVPGLSFPDMHWSIALFWGITGLTLLRALASVVWHANERVISFRKHHLVFFWFLATTLATFLLSGRSSVYHSTLLFIPAAFYFTYYFFDRPVKRKWLANLHLYLLLISLTLIYLFSEDALERFFL